MSVITQKTDNICDGGAKKITKRSVLMHYSDNICDLGLDGNQPNYKW